MVRLTSSEEIASAVWDEEIPERLSDEDWERLQRVFDAMDRRTRRERLMLAALQIGVILLWVWIALR